MMGGRRRFAGASGPCLTPPAAVHRTATDSRLQPMESPEFCKRLRRHPQSSELPIERLIPLFGIPSQGYGPDLLDTSPTCSSRSGEGRRSTRMAVLWATQGRDTARQFGARLRATVSGSGGDQVTYAEEPMREVARKVRAEGMLEGQVGTIESLVRAGVRLPVIEGATGIEQDALRALEQQLAGSEEGTKEAD